jgi:hypothetical protein
MKKKVDNKIFGLAFKRKKNILKHHKIEIILEKDIPPMGYGPKEIIKLLREYNKE